MGCGSVVRIISLWFRAAEMISDTAKGQELWRGEVGMDSIGEQ